MSTATNLLQIWRFRAEYLISAEHPDPHLIKSRFDETIERRLAPVLSDVFSPWFSNSDSSVWVIRRLEVDVALSAALGRDQITRAFTAQIGKSLAMAIQEGADTSNVLRFPNRAAYLASLLNDLANGDAWSKWYYESFRGLKPLPVSAALRTAICDERSTGLEALRTLASFELDRVIQNLSSGDARRILETISPDDPALEGSFEAALSAWSGNRPASTWDTWQRALHIYVTAERSSPDAGGGLRSAALAISHLAGLLCNGSEEENARLVNALVQGDPAALYVAAMDADVEFLLPLLTCPIAWRREVVRTILGRDEPHKPAERAGEPAGTMHGGIFLLLPILDDLPLAECVLGWPNIDSAAAVSLVRFLMLVKCCGRDRVREAFYDPVVRDLLLIAPDVTPAHIREWQAGITNHNLEQFLDSLIEWQLTRSAVTSECQLLVASTYREQIVAVLADGARGLWLMVRQYDHAKPDEMIESLRGHLLRSSDNAGWLICDSSMLQAVGGEFEKLRIMGVDDADAESFSADAGSCAGALLARLDRISDDLDHLSPGATIDIDRSLDLVLTLAAQHVLRSFAYRLPGFAGSNLPYLWRNFLDFRASIEDDVDRRVVRLRRPPLHLILSITGMARQTYSVSWQDGRPLTLFQED